MKVLTETNSAFSNEQHIDWTALENREKMRKALIAVRNDWGKAYPSLINGCEYFGQAILPSFDPACFRDTLGIIYTDEKYVCMAAHVAEVALLDWNELGVEKRGEILLKAAEIIKGKKFELASWLVYEVSKSWDEAMGEIEEAIDFIRLYALAAKEYGKETRRQPQVRSENNYTKYAPRGITAAISSWNFPFSLLVEKIASSLAAGCPVLVKPAEQSPITGWHAVKCFLEARVPAGVIAYLPGGAQIGEALVRRGEVTQITFTGSKEVGLRIAKTAAEFSTGGFKRVDLETGGNNAMIICPSANMDKALQDAMRSKFSFNGQKCSALQRLIMVGKMEDMWIRDFIERISLDSLVLGHPENPETTLTALIDKDAQNSVKQKVNTLKEIIPGICFKERSGLLPEMGAFVNPIVFYDIPDRLADHKIISEEIFGPVLFVFCLPSLEAAVKFANSTEYGLTAGIYSELEKDADYFLKNMRAGNLYVRRRVTGAIVDRQPFGGIKFSGMGHKVGMAERLKFYLDEVSISRNLLSYGMLTQ